MSAAVSLPVPIGGLVEQKYRIESVLGHGGMGIVAKATHVQLGRAVAIKFLLADTAMHPDFVERFHREARAASRINSEHVARVLDVGSLESGAPYMVMEFLEGEDLAVRLTKRKRFGVVEAIQYMLQTCEALSVSHRERIVHRDLKPANLFAAKVGDREVVKVLDFGISKSLDGRESAGLTQTSAMLGTALYMAPEQLRKRKDIDERVDIWALGVILYEFLTGQMPFWAETLPEVIATILEGEVTPITEHGVVIPPGIEAIVTRCLTLDPHQRFGSAQELAEALLPFAGDHPWASQRLSITPPPLSVQSATFGTSTLVEPTVGLNVQGARYSVAPSALAGSIPITTSTLGVMPPTRGEEGAPRAGAGAAVSQTGFAATKTLGNETTRRRASRMSLLVLVSVCALGVGASAFGVHRWMTAQPSNPTSSAPQFASAAASAAPSSAAQTATAPEAGAPITVEIVHSAPSVSANAPNDSTKLVGGRAPAAAPLASVLPALSAGSPAGFSFGLPAAPVTLPPPPQTTSGKNKLDRLGNLKE